MRFYVDYTPFDLEVSVETDGYAQYYILKAATVAQTPNGEPKGVYLSDATSRTFDDAMRSLVRNIKSNR